VSRFTVRAASINAALNAHLSSFFRLLVVMRAITTASLNWMKSDIIMSLSFA
jgi:hypothetical protein